MRMVTKQMSTRGGFWSYLACAFKSDLKGKVDESKGTLLPMHGILLFSKENEHPMVGLGAQNEWVWASNGHCMCIQVGFEW